MKTVLIFGASKPGYAEAVTRRMIEEGNFVIGTFDKEYSDNAKKLTDEYSSSQLILSEVDLSLRENLRLFVNQIQEPIDGLIYAQFYFSMENHDNFDYESWDKSIAINFSAPNFLIHELKNKFKENASIIIITSSEAYRGSYGASAYAATKAAIHNLVKSLANILGNKGIRVNALPVGWVGGEMDTDEIFSKSRALTPLKRLGTSEEIASVVNFLYSPAASFINGTTLITDGGYLCSDPLAQYEYEESNPNA